MKIKLLRDGSMPFIQINRAILLDVDDEGAHAIHMLLNSVQPTKRGCETGDACMWDTQTGLHVDGTPCLYMHGERGPSLPTDQASESEE